MHRLLSIFQSASTQQMNWLSSLLTKPTKLCLVRTIFSLWLQWQLSSSTCAPSPTLLSHIPKLSSWHLRKHQRPITLLNPTTAISFGNVWIAPPLCQESSRPPKPPSTIYSANDTKHLVNSWLCVIYAPVIASNQYTATASQSNKMLVISYGGIHTIVPPWSASALSYWCSKKTTCAKVG